MTKLLVLLLALTGAAVQQPGSMPSDTEALKRKAQLDAERASQAAIHINDLASQVRTEADAEALVDAVAAALPELVPPGPAGRMIRQRVARAEFQAVSDPSKGISEQQIADVWNEYVQTIGAPAETIVSGSDIHLLRDWFYTTNKIMWTHPNYRMLWLVPAIYSVSPEGNLTENCRALESVRLLYELETLFYSLRHVRGQSPIDAQVVEAMIKMAEDPSKKAVGVLGVRVDTNPVWPAQAQYVRLHGQEELNLLILRLFDKLFPASN